MIKLIYNILRLWKGSLSVWETILVPVAILSILVPGPRRLRDEKRAIGKTMHPKRDENSLHRAFFRPGLHHESLGLLVLEIHVKPGNELVIREIRVSHA